MYGLLKGVGLMALLFVGGGVQAPEPTSYLCIPDYATGFSHKSGEWRPVNFNVDGQKYVVVRRERGWFWVDFGEEPASWEDPCEGFDDYGFLRCKVDLTTNVVFNRKTMRYQAVMHIGYVVADTTLTGNTPYIEIGRCTPL